jgi:hypothetical protein
VVAWSYWLAACGLLSLVNNGGFPVVFMQKIIDLPISIIFDLVVNEFRNLSVEIYGLGTPSSLIRMGSDHAPIH